MERQALRDINTNSPSVKRQKVSGSAENAVRRQEQQQQQQATDFAVWQRSWRRIMLDSVIYFDSNDSNINNVEYINTKKKAMKMFTQIGAKVQLFFDHTVTIVVSRRDKSDLPKNILQYDKNLKFWKYDKVFRFLANLGETTSPIVSVPSVQKQQLHSLLNNEKLHGPSDRDPSAKRDDYNYFKYNYFFVYDLRQKTRPIAIREWKAKDKSDKKPWPHIYNSTYGRSLFQPDPADSNLPRKLERRRLRDEQNKKHRYRLRMVYELHLVSPDLSVGNITEDCDSEEDSSETNDSNDNVLKHKSAHQLNMPPPVAQLSRQGSLITNKFMEATQRDGFEIQASGFNGSTNVSQQSTTDIQTKNGLAPMVSSVSSKKVNSLAKKVVSKQQKKGSVTTATANTSASTNNNNNHTTHTTTAAATAATASKTTKEKVSGYCENCRIHFEDFDVHIESGKHRSFARKEENFQDIDNLIEKLHQQIALKR